MLTNLKGILNIFMDKVKIVARKLFSVVNEQVRAFVNNGTFTRSMKVLGLSFVVLVLSPFVSSFVMGELILIAAMLYLKGKALHDADIMNLRAQRKKSA